MEINQDFTVGDIDLDKMEKAYIAYDNRTGYFEILAELPAGVTLTAGELENEFAVCDISHWTQDDLVEFMDHSSGDQYSIIENLEFGVFAEEMREHNSNLGLAFGMGSK